jgi:hypothetical protein
MDVRQQRRKKLKKRRKSEWVVAPNSFHTFLIDKMADLSFLAGLLLKLHSGQSWTDEEVASLQILAPKVDAIPEVRTEVPEPPAPLSPPEVPKHEGPKRVKKVKKVEATEPATPVEIPTEPVTPVEEPSVPAAPAAPAPEPKPVLEISAKHCLARMVQKNKVVPGTEDNKVYETKQCIRLRAKGHLLCPKCEEYYTAYKEKAKGKAQWEGFINEKPLDTLHVVGSKWFHEHYPGGLAQTTELLAPVPSDPTKETILAENAPIVEVKWATIKLGGVHYIYNTHNRNIYRADVGKEGEDQVIWESFGGKYINGTIDTYAPETEDAP